MQGPGNYTDAACTALNHLEKSTAHQQLIGRRAFRHKVRERRLITMIRSFTRGRRVTGPAQDSSITTQQRSRKTGGPSGDHQALGLGTEAGRTSNIRPGPAPQKQRHLTVPPPTHLSYQGYQQSPSHARAILLP